MTTLDIVSYVPDASADQAHLALKTAVKSMDQARHCAVLWFREILERKLYLPRGYSSMNRYAETELGFSPTRCGNFIQLARKLDRLPHLRKDLQDGKLGYTKALEVIKVADPANEEQWVKQARSLPRKDLRHLVNKARAETRVRQKENPRQKQLLPRKEITAPPVALKHRISVEMSSEQLARYEALLEKLKKLEQGSQIQDPAEMILNGLGSLAGFAGFAGFAGIAGLADEASPNQAAVQIHVHECPACQKATLATTRGELPLSSGEAEHLHCEARIDGEGSRLKTSVGPKTRRRVLARDRHRCQAEGCRHTQYLEVHHIVPRSKGGSHRAENLITLCGACHRLLHQRPAAVRIHPPAGVLAKAESAPG